MEILRHELTHRMQELSPRQYGKYRDYVIRQYTAADAAAKYEAYRRAGHPLTPEQVVDELVADYAGRHLREEGAIRRLAGENRTLAEWVRGSIRALAERIREKLGRAEPTLEHAQRLWERAFRAAEQHASRQNPSVPLPGPETSARYSIREEIDSQEKEAYTEETTDNGGSDSADTQIPRTGDNWYDHFNEKYGKGSVTWKPTSFEDILQNPERLYGSTQEEIANILGDGWIQGNYGVTGTGWKFTNGDGMVFYHSGGRHGGSYYGFSTGATGKVKIVGEDYIPLPGDKATVIYFKGD